MSSYHSVNGDGQFL